MASANYLNLAWKALHTPQGRAVARKATETIADAGNRITKNKYEAQIAQGRAAVLKHFSDPEPKRKGPFKRR